MKELYDFIKEREYIETLDQPIEDFLYDHKNSVAEWKDTTFTSDIDSTYYSEYLYESLLHSYSLEKFLSRLQKLFVIHLYQFGQDKSVLHIRVGSDFDKNNKDFVSICNLFNVFISKDEPRTGVIHDITFEQYKPKDVTDEVNQYDFVYHLTSSKVVDKILKYGLQPKSHSKKSYHPERVYLLLPGANLKSMMKQLGADTILKIDINKLRTYNQKIRFYSDPMSVGGNAIFTENIIYPEVIEKIED